MNMKMIAGACLCATAIVGCVSVEQTRQQLQSKDSAEVKKAEENIFRIATEGRDPSGFVKFTPQQQVEYVALAPNNALLLKILDRSYQDEVTLAAANKLDFTKEGLSMEILTKHKDIVSKVSRSKESASGNTHSYDRSSKDLSKSGGAGFKGKLFSALKENELVQLLNGDIDYTLKKDVARRLLAVTKDTNILVKMFDGDLRDRVGNDGRATAAKKLIANATAISDKDVIGKLLKSEYAKLEDDRKALLSKFSENEVVQYTTEAIDRHNVYLWNKDDLTALNDGVVVTSIVKNPESVVKIVSAILAKIASYRKECKDSWTMSWGSEDDKKASNLIKGFPKFSDATISELICADETSWKYFIDGVSGNVAYDVLSKGKAKSVQLELSLVKKLPKEKVDMAVYNGVKYDDTKKAVNAAMSPELKKQAAEAAEKAYAAILDKAKNAAKETFELDGFYLGMSFDDMKVVFAHHFPDWQIKEAIDGEGKEADFVIYVPGQKSPFCYADCGDKKVYQFNFGKKVLKKWYKYDVQNYAQWAIAYSRENKIDMQYKMVEKEATVYEPMDMSRSYRVWFYQHSYQYKHNAKEYRVTYFGDEKDFTVHGGIGGSLIKELAAPEFRYTRGDPGSLRVMIEKD